MELFLRQGQPQKANSRNDAGKPRWMHQGPCGRCGGAGGAEKWRHTGWTCFDCQGSGKGRVIWEPLYTAEELAKLNAIAAKKAANKMAKAKAKAEKAEAERAAAVIARAEQLAADPYFAKLGAYAGKNDFLADLHAKMRAADLSERQMEAANEAIARIDAKEAEAANSHYVGAEGERIKIAGKVVFAKCIYASEGRWNDPDRWLIKIALDDGAVVKWFTSGYAPGEGTALIGTAKVKAHNEYQGVKETLITNPRWKDKKVGERGESRADREAAQ